MPDNQPDANVPFDPEPLQRLLAATNDPQVVRDIAQVFYADAVMQLNGLQRLASADDLSQLARAAHKFKGACLTVGLRRCASLCEQIDQLARKQEVAVIAPVVQELVEHFPKARKSMEAAIT